MSTEILVRVEGLKRYYGEHAAVRSEKTKDLAAFDVEADAANGCMLAVVSLQSLDANQDLR